MSTCPQLPSIYKVFSYLTGDVIGIHVTSFSRDKSSVMILKNGHPVCTKYHYEQDHEQFYPTIVLEHGPIDLTVTWQNAVTSLPQYDYERLESFLAKTKFPGLLDLTALTLFFLIFY